MRWVCLRCSLRFNWSVRQLIGEWIRPFGPEVLCFCDQGSA